MFNISLVRPNNFSKMMLSLCVRAIAYTLKERNLKYTERDLSFLDIFILCRWPYSRDQIDYEEGSCRASDLICGNHMLPGEITYLTPITN